MVARSLPVVLIDFAVAVFPRMKLAKCYTDPKYKLDGRQVGPPRPVLDVVDDLITGVMGNPASF